MSVEPAAVDQEFTQLVDDILSRHGNVQATGADPLDTELWATLENSGLTRLTGTGPHGSGATWLEAAALLRRAASFAVPLPLAEHDLLAGWLAEIAGLPDGDGIRTAAILDGDGRAVGVPWADRADSLVALVPRGANWHIVEVLRADMETTSGASLAGEPRDAVLVESAALDGGVEVAPQIVTEFGLRGGLARSVQISGALQRAVGLAVDYSVRRTQFGRPIAGFQAVQRLASDAATETALTLTAVDAAVATVVESTEWTAPEVVLAVATAKSIASSAASTASRAIHQIFGAIGTTAEHSLRTLTLPALAWASEFGTAASWNRTIIELVATPGDARDLWALLTRTGA